MNPKKPRPTRRQFLGAAAAVPALGAMGREAPTVFVPRRTGPVAVSSRNGLEAVKVAIAKMSSGVRPVDAAVAGVNLVENDPNDMSVGYGGLPNADGVVELDSCVMDGPTHLAGAVGALRNIKNPSRVALLVMRRTDHVLLVGEGALRFARAHGIPETNLLTDRAREVWLAWRERMSNSDDWIEPGGNALPNKSAPRAPASQGANRGKEHAPLERKHGTIHLSALDGAGRFGACTTTSGLSFKIPGRVGDSPLIGCGLYLDNDIGSAGSTGRGEAAILSNGSHTVVEQMRLGRSPTDACLEVLRRVAHYTRIPRLLTPQGRPNFQLNFYALNKKGELGAASMYPSSYSVGTMDGAEHRSTAALFERR